MFPMPPSFVIDDFLDQATKQALMDWVLANEGKFDQSTIYSGQEDIVEPSARISLTMRDFGPLKPAIRKAMLDALPTIAEGLGTEPSDKAKLELELAAHGDGAHFHRHLDTVIGETLASPVKQGMAERKISAVYYFHRHPRAFEGGELRLYRWGKSTDDAAPEDQETFQPRDNRLVAFLSWAPHEVLTVNCPSRAFADYRFAINCWYCWPEAG